MTDKTPSNSDIINNVRNLAISRRGGVRTRGGRLPPINMRNLTQMTGNKKVIVPKIPQRRKIKTETELSGEMVVKTEKSQFSEKSRGKGRQQRVYLQTEGSFLAEGPAARIKREPFEDTLSIPRSSRRAAASSRMDKNIDIDAIKDIMESYVADEEYENNRGKPPFRLPLQKMTNKIKLEADGDDKMKIKKEIETESKEEIKTEIKKEIIDDFETGLKMEIKTEDDSTDVKCEVIHKEDVEEKPFADKFINIKDDKSLLLLQLPVLTHNLKVEDSEEDDVKNKQSAEGGDTILKSKLLDNFEEGLIGKLKIMKSGRMKLTLGSAEFELSDGSSSETYQEVVSIQIREDKEGDVTVLGKIDHKLLLNPVIKELLPKSSKTLDFEEK